MGKKKTIKLAETSIKILKSGKIKIKKGQKIDLEPYVKKSVDECIVSRLDGIISKESVVVETSQLRLDKSYNLISDIRSAELIARTDSPITNTIVLTVSKKDAIDSFDLLNGDTLGTILRTSTLASIYREIKSSWVELNDDDRSTFTNVMYIPNIMVFVDSETGKFRKKPFYLNLLLLAVPNASKMVENGVEKLSDEDVSSRVIADMMDAAIRCGAKDLIISPFGYKALEKDPHTTAKLWDQIMTSQRCIEQLHSVVFTIEDEDMYIIFNAQRTN